MARFCFLSELGEYEYYFEFTEDQGAINLLLYYDTEDQWPSVYKTNKSCREKEGVLKLEQNQIINLTTKYPYSELSGCYYAPNEWTDPPKQQTISIPTVPTKKTTKTTLKTTTTTTESTITTTENVFNATTEDVNMQFEEIFENLEDFAYEFNVSSMFILFPPPHRTATSQDLTSLQLAGSGYDALCYPLHKYQWWWEEYKYANKSAIDVFWLRTHCRQQQWKFRLGNVGLNRTINHRRRVIEE